MSEYIKYFENGGKDDKKINGVIKNDSMLDKYNEIQNKIKKTLNTKLHSMSAHDKKYITSFWSNKIPKEGVHHTCIACMTIDSVMKMDKKIIHKFIQKNVSIK